MAKQNNLSIKKEKIMDKIAFSVNIKGIVGVAGASYGLGLITGITGRVMGGENQYIIPAIPAALDLMGTGDFNKYRALAYLSYGAGIATVHADNIFNSISNYLS